MLVELPGVSCGGELGGGCCDLGADGFCDLCGGGGAAEVAGVEGWVGGDVFDGEHEALGGSWLADVFEEHDSGPEGADRVGEAFAHDVEGGAVDGLEHGGVEALGVDVAGGCDAEAAGEGGGEVAEDIGMEVCGDDGVEGGGAVDHAGGGGVDELFVPGDVGEFGGDLGCDLVPHDHGVALGVALGDDGEELAGAGLGEAKGIAVDAFDAGAGHEGEVGGDLDGVTLVHASAYTGVLAFGVFADDDPVEVGGGAAFERGIDAG